VSGAVFGILSRTTFDFTMNISTSPRGMALVRRLRQAGLALAATLALGAGTAPAQAAMLTGSQLPAGTVVTDFSAPGLLSFDLDLASDGSVLLEFALEAGDLGAPLSFSSVIRNFTGQGLNRLLFEFGGVTLSSMGSVARSFGGTASVQSGPGFALVSLTPPEFLDIEIGNPLGRLGQVDWTLDTTGLSAGDRIRVAFSLSEPPALALAASLLLALAALRVRRG
jgi:hypothetical protein